VVGGVEERERGALWIRPFPFRGEGGQGYAAWLTGNSSSIFVLYFLFCWIGSRLIRLGFLFLFFVEISFIDL